MSDRILPTTHCFDDALEFLGRRVQADRTLAGRTTLRLVHAIVLMPEETDGSLAPGEPFCHAWVEEDTEGRVLVWQSGLRESDGAFLDFAVERAEYVAAMRLQEATSYSCLEAWLENKRTGHYGPWRAKYRALVGRR